MPLPEYWALAAARVADVGLSEFGDDEAVHPNRLRLARGVLLTAAILEVSDKPFLFGVDREGKFTGCLERRHRALM